MKKEKPYKFRHVPAVTDPSIGTMVATFLRGKKIMVPVTSSENNCKAKLNIADGVSGIIVVCGPKLRAMGYE